MPKAIAKSFETPDEIRPVAKGKLDVVQLGDAAVMRATFEPGWRWSECLKSVAGTESCQAAHLGYMIQGRMKIKMDDGSETEIGPGEVALIPPGHDAWIVGNERAVFIDFQGGSVYAKPH